MQGKKMSDPATQLPQLSNSSRRTLDANNCSDKRVYQVWKGSNRFFLGGRIIFGPDARSLIFTIFLIVSPVIFFCIFASGRLINEFQHHLGGLIAAIPAAFTAYILLLLFLTSGRDPGIIPRNPHPPEPEEEGDLSSLSTEWAATQGPASTLPPTKEVLVNGTVIKIKYCHTCMLYRPPRCSHCSICNNCVERFDHHCPWVGQCIGKRNYRFFFMFVFSTTMLAIYIFAFCWVNVKYIMEAYHCNLWKALLKSPVSGVLILYTFIGTWFVGGLTSFHIYLISTNQTTYENFRYRYDGKMNPYNIGLVANFAETFFTKIPRSRNNFRAKVKENTVSNLTSSMGRVMSPELPKTSFDIEMGGKRQTVAEEELEDIQNQIETVAGLERCGTQPRHTNWGHKGNWEITPDVNAMASEFGTNHCVSDREKINGIL